MSPAWSSATSLAVPALHHLHVLQPLGGIAVEILNGGVVFQHAGNHFEIVDAPREGVRDGLENKERERLGVRDFSLHGFTLVIGALVTGGRAAHRRGGKNLGAEVQDGVGADIVNRRGEQDRKDFLVPNFFVQPLVRKLSAGSVPLSKNSCINSSSPSATISTSFSCAA